MNQLKRHRLFLYGRSGLSILLFVTSMVLGVVQALTAAGQTVLWVASGTLIASVVVLPRTTEPQNEEAREEATGEELDYFRSLRRWLTWARLVYLLVAVGVFLGLPELL